MSELKEDATRKMLKENSEPSIEREWKKDRFFLPGQIDDADGKSSGGKRENK
jgi:hypothetical protein